MTEPSPADAEQTNPPATPVRVPTSSLAAFRDLDPTSAAQQGRARRRSGSLAASVALVCGLALTVAMIVVGFAGSFRLMQEAGRPVVIVMFVLLAGVAGLAVAAGTRAVLVHRRTGSGGWGRAIIGSIAALISIGLLADLLFSPNPAERDPSTSAIAVGGELLIVELLLGDCLSGRPPARYDDPTASVIVVPCTDPHAFEVMAVLELPAHDQAMAQRCDIATRTSNGSAPDGEVITVAPTREIYATYGVGSLLCLVA